MDPFTIAAALGAAGKLFGGITGFLGANNKALALKYAGEQAQSEAGLAGQQALEQGEQTEARAATQVAANGGGFTGSAMGELAQLNKTAQFNARAAVYRGNTEAQRDLYEGGVAKAQGLQGLVSSVAGAGASIAGGIGQSAQMGQQLSALKSLRGDGGGMGSGASDDEMAGLF